MSASTVVLFGPSRSGEAFGFLGRGRTITTPSYKLSFLTLTKEFKDESIIGGINASSCTCSASSGFAAFRLLGIRAPPRKRNKYSCSPRP